MHLLAQLIGLDALLRRQYFVVDFRDHPLSLNQQLLQSRRLLIRDCLSFGFIKSSPVVADDKVPHWFANWRSSGTTVGRSAAQIVLTSALWASVRSSLRARNIRGNPPGPARMHHPYRPGKWSARAMPMAPAVINKTAAVMYKWRFI
jgi:hypothetical protein